MDHDKPVRFSDLPVGARFMLTHHSDGVFYKSGPRHCRRTTDRAGAASIEMKFLGLRVFPEHAAPFQRRRRRR